MCGDHPKDGSRQEEKVKTLSLVKVFILDILARKY